MRRLAPPSETVNAHETSEASPTSRTPPTESAAIRRPGNNTGEPRAPRPTPISRHLTSEEQAVSTAGNQLSRRNRSGGLSTLLADRISTPRGHDWKAKTPHPHGRSGFPPSKNVDVRPSRRLPRISFPLFSRFPGPIAPRTPARGRPRHPPKPSQGLSFQIVISCPDPHEGLE